MQTFVDWIGAVVLAAILIVVVGAWGFVELLDEVREGDTQTIDEWVMRRVALWHGSEHRHLEEIGRDITALGSVTVLSLCTLAVVIFLLLVRNYRAMWLVIIATLGGQGLSSVLKYFIARERPTVSEHLTHVYTASFPSGHAMMSAVVYLTLGSLLAGIVRRTRLRVFFLALALVLTFLVGVSRVYMGVHWPTDVLAGWTAGLVWAILCWLVARWLRRRGTIADATGDEA